MPRLARQNLRRDVSHLPFAGGLLAGALAAGCGGRDDEAGRWAGDEPTPGYPPATSRLSLRLTNELQKHCHATLVDRGWALTAAHCFSGVDPDARGALPDFQRNIPTSEVEFYPGAHVSLATRRDAVWASAEFVAAHDLALVPIDPPLDDVLPVSRWAASSGCELPLEYPMVGQFGQIGEQGQAQTAHAAIVGKVEASSLLGPSQPGWLLAAEGPRVGPGDSGSGVTIAWQDLEHHAATCALRQQSEGAAVLVGVIQDAHPNDFTLPFGLVPLDVVQHAEWLAATIATPPKQVRTEPPRLEP